jgi:hypothetical protein
MDDHNTHQVSKKYSLPTDFGRKAASFRLKPPYPLRSLPAARIFLAPHALNAATIRDNPGSSVSHLCPL